jgi:5-methylcytosine-specific restriction endonuclease McrA
VNRSIDVETFRCGHPKSPENSAPNGANTTCRECKNARRRERYATNPEPFREATKQRTRKHRGGLKGNANARKDTCAQGHPYDEENTYVYKGNRQCKTCRKQRVMESWARHGERYAASHREWYQQNRDKAIAATKRWSEANPERVALTSRLKKQRRRAAGVLTAAEWRLILALHGHRCLSCGSDGPLTIDHVIPVSKGGPNTAANVQPLCGPCNSSKATKTIDYRPTLAAV